MERYKYTKLAINAFRHEYKLLCAGKVTVQDLPETCIQGLLYYFMSQLVDSLRLRYSIDAKIDDVAEAIEDYNFNIGIGIPTSDDEILYGYDNLLKPVQPLLDVREILEDAGNELASWCDNLEGFIENLTKRLLSMAEQAKEFYGGESAFTAVKELWQNDEYMDSLEEIILMELEEKETDDRIEMIVDALMDYTKADESQSVDWTSMSDDELPFN